MKPTKITVQMFDGDGVEPTDIKQARLQREADERTAEITRKRVAEKARYEAKRLRRELNYKQSLKDHPLTVACIQLALQPAGQFTKLTLLTELPPDVFRYIQEIPRPKLTVQTPMDNLVRDIAHLEYPKVFTYHNPVVHAFNYEKVAGGQRPDGEHVQVYRYDLTISYSKMQDFSSRTYKKLKAFYAKIPA